MAFVLSRTEVEALLASGGRSTLPAAPRTADAARSGLRPDQLDPQLVERLEPVLTRFADDYARQLAEDLSLTVKLSLQGISNRRREDLLRGTADDGGFELTCEGTEERAILVIDGSLLSPLVDAILGGESVGEEIRPGSRRLTEFERLLVLRFAEPAGRVLAEKIRAGRPPGDPERRSPLVVAGFGISVGESSGLIELGLTRPLVDQLLAGALPDSSSRELLDGPTGSRLLAARLAATTLQRNDLRSLAVGDIIVTESAATDRAGVLIDGVQAFEALPGALGGRRAVRLQAAGGDSSPDDPSAVDC